MKEIILASASERRSRILSDCKIAHKVMPSNIEEDSSGEKAASEIVQSNAIAKARKIAEENKGSIIIGADTLVAHGASIIGKPGSEKAAKELLGKFSGEEVEVYTGLCVIDSSLEKEAAGFEKSTLLAERLSPKEIERYFRLLGPYDKAGGFSIEGAGSLIFDNIKGSYFNILGLPMIKLKNLFREVGLDILDYM